MFTTLIRPEEKQKTKKKQLVHSLAQALTLTLTNKPQRMASTPFDLILSSTTDYKYFNKFACVRWITYNKMT